MAGRQRSLDGETGKVGEKVSKKSLRQKYRSLGPASDQCVGTISEGRCRPKVSKKHTYKLSFIGRYLKLQLFFFFFFYELPILPECGVERGRGVMLQTFGKFSKNLTFRAITIFPLSYC